LSDPIVSENETGATTTHAADWNRLLLAPLVKLSKTAVYPIPNCVIINIANSRGLLEESQVPYTPDEIVVSMHKDPAQLESALFNLEQHLNTRSPESREKISQQIFDAARIIAEYSEGKEGQISIEPAEVDFLSELRRVLKLQTSGSKDISKALVSKKTPVDPIIWAAEWTESMEDASFELLVGMHEHHENEWKSGHGLLDQVTQLRNLPLTLDNPVCDQGVLVFPQAWADRKIWIIGDLHGDFRALESALTTIGVGKDGMPENSVILLLGDYGDRGSGTLAVWLRIASLKKRFPKQIFLLRGNHEETVAMRLTRVDTGRTLNTLWHVPTTTGMESYLMLAMALHGNLGDVATLYCQIPDLALLPGGVIALHGCLPPRWKEKDGWRGTDEEKESLTIRNLADLRKTAVRGTLRWTDFTDRDEITEGWGDHARGSRLFADCQDLSHWRGVIGDFRMVHGHTHPSEGTCWEDQKRVLALNTSSHTALKLGIAVLEQGTLQTIPIT